MRMTETAEAFTSMGLPELPESFGRTPVGGTHRPRCGVSCQCVDLDNGNDPVSSNVEATEEQLATLHHELGHIYYYLMYKDLRPFFKGGAHDGFHEAIGDTIVLSMTPDYLHEKGCSRSRQRRGVINQQMKLAVKSPFCPLVSLSTSGVGKCSQAKLRLTVQCGWYFWESY